MKNGINKVTLVGNVGDAPKVNSNGEAVNFAQFSLATNESYTDKDGKAIKRTEWHRVVAFNKSAEIIKTYVKKGDPLYVEGKLRTNNWEDKEGVKHASTEIVCDNFLMLSTKGDPNN